MPANFKSAIFLLLKGMAGYEETVRMGIASGGCTCSRVMFVGACLGGYYGLKAIPYEWIAKTKNIPRAVELVQKLFLK